MVRGSAHNWDIRKTQPYELYSALDFSTPVSDDGDCLGRYITRMNEMWTSIIIIAQCLRATPKSGPIKIADNRIVPPIRHSLKHSTEATINHFKFYSEGFSVPAGLTYSAVEAPKGEFGVLLASDGSTRPYRCHARAPGLHHLQGIQFTAKNHLLADVVTIIGTQDIVFGEVDR